MEGLTYLVPRVSLDEHLGRRDLLVACWDYIPELIALLIANAQWELHRFYAPSRKLTDDEFSYPNVLGNES